MKAFRCCICGRFMNFEAEIANVSMTMVSDFDEAEPALAHRSCAERE